MIQPIGMSESLQRALMGLGGIGTAIQDARKTQAGVANTNAQTAATVADTAGKDTANQQALLSFRNSMRQRQLLDSLSSNEAQTQLLQSAGPQAAQDPLNGAAGPLAPGQERIPATPGVLSNAGMASLQQMPQDHARLVAQLQRESGAFGATPELAQAQHAASLTQTQNAGAMSNLDVAGKQTANDTNALALSTAKATQPAAIAAGLQEPLLGQKKIGLMGAQANEANAKAGKEKILQQAQGADTDGLAKDLVSGNTNWDEFKTLMSSRGPEGAAARLAVYNKAKTLDPNFNPSELEKSWKMYNNSTNQTAVAQIDNVKPNLKTLVDLSNQISRTGLPAVNKMILSGGYQVGGKAVTNFDEMRKALSDELGTALSGKGQMTDEKLNLAKSMLQADPSEENYASNIELIDHMLDTRRNTIIKPMGVYGKRLAPDQASGSMGASGVTQIKDDSDYDKLPSGTKFIGPDGKTRVKP